MSESTASQFAVSQVTLCSTTSGALVPSLAGRLFCSGRDPQKEARSWFQLQLPFLKNSRQVLLVGLGAGIHLQEILSSSVCPQRIRVVEREEGLVQHWKNSQRQSEVCPWVQVDFLSTAETLPRESFQEFLMLEFRPAWNGNENFYQELVQKIRGPSIKEILVQVSSQDQSKTAKIWRALQELVR